MNGLLKVFSVGLGISKELRNDGIAKRVYVGECMGSCLVEVF